MLYRLEQQINNIDDKLDCNWIVTHTINLGHILESMGGFPNTKCKIRYDSVAGRLFIVAETCVYAVYMWTHSK